MTIRLTLFTATLVQDSALSVSGLDRESGADQPFTIVDGVPTIAGRALKGAAVAMARRFFDPLPRAVSDDIQYGALRRSIWEFADVTTTATPRLRAGVGIRQKTGARAHGVLYDREVIPAGTHWPLVIRVDRSYAVNDNEFTEAEGILGYVLEKHWKEGRCWLGGDVARGLGWCHLEDLKAYRFDAESYDRWVVSGRTHLPDPLTAIPMVEPTRSWCFRTLDIEVSFGEYRPDPNESAWGLDMLAIGTHDAERTVQPTGDGEWAKPAWAANAATPDALLTDRTILMDGNRPLLPGSSFRGPLRHAYSRAERAAGREVKDPHPFQGNVGEDDPAGRAFGTVNRSSRILIRDARAEEGWAAARLHMHAEDEFSAGSYGSAKRDGVRLLKGVFPVSIVVEGPTPEEVEPLVTLIEDQVALGALGHLPIGGHKTRGAGWGRWHVCRRCIDDVKKVRDWAPPEELDVSTLAAQPGTTAGFLKARDPEIVGVRIQQGSLNGSLTLGTAAQQAQLDLGSHALVAWWCDPSIDLSRNNPPATFGYDWPLDSDVLVDEVAFFAERAVWRAARTAGGPRYVFIKELDASTTDSIKGRATCIPARLHDYRRFSAVRTGRGQVLLREWRVDDEVLGFTIAELQKI